MRLSQAFWQTSKQATSDADVISHKLMSRAGLIHKTASGIYSYLPMGQRVMQKISQVVREEMDRSGAQELQMAMVTPADLWQESERWQEYGQELLRLEDRHGREMCLSPTNEETVTDIFRKHVKSYKQLPINLYQIHTKFRDEIRPRFGLMRGREFIMKDAYSFHLDKAGLDETYEIMFQTYTRIFERLGLQCFAVEADAGAMAGSSAKTHEFQVLADTGEDSLVLMPGEQTGANVEKVQTVRPNVPRQEQAPLEEIDTKDCSTIEDVAQYCKTEKVFLIKSLAYEGVREDGEQITILAMLLGDDQLNEIKLKKALGLKALRPCSEEALKEQGLVPGYLGPLDASADVILVRDEAIHGDGAYIVGANKMHMHLKGFVFERDLKTECAVADLRLAMPGDFAPGTQKEVVFKRGIEVGHIFQLGDKYTKALKATIP